MQAKKEQLKKGGKLLTPKRKAERATAEARRAALLSSGNVTIAGLAEKDGSAPTVAAEKKVSYGKIEKKQPPAYVKKPVIAQQAPDVASEEVKREAEDNAVKAAKAVEVKKSEEKGVEEEEEEKDDWDISSSEDEEEKAAKAKKVEEEAKDSWDASSSDEEDAKIVAKPVKKKVKEKKPAEGAIYYFLPFPLLQ